VISPTFVLARVHRSGFGGPPLVHVDAYRLSGADELDDLGLDESGPTAVTVVEWGTGLAEALADSRLEVDIRRSAVPAPLAPEAADAAIDEHRTVLLRGVGDRWDEAELTALRGLGDMLQAQQV
jgi:tRNA threonylcarbamoyladenosine biosynthesis protein TsaE